MKATLKFEIECGEKTCAWERGKICRNRIPAAHGNDRCFFFGRLSWGEGDLKGWLMRHPECLKRAEENED